MICVGVNRVEKVALSGFASNVPRWGVYPMGDAPPPWMTPNVEYIRSIIDL